MGNLGMTLFEAQMRDRMQREAVVRQQQAQQSATNQLQEQVGWDRAFKERDQVAGQEEAKHKRALDWAQLKGSAAGIEGRAADPMDTPDEENQAEAYRQFAGAETGFKQGQAQAANEAAVGKLMIGDRRARELAEQQHFDRMMGLQQTEASQKENRSLREEIHQDNLRRAYSQQELTRQIANMGNIQREEFNTRDDVEKAGKQLQPQAGMQNNLITIAGALDEYKQNRDISGVGMVAGRVPNWAAGFTSGAKGIAIRSAIEQTNLDLQKVDSGLAIGERETVRRLAASLLDPSLPDEQVARGLRQLLAKAAQARRSVQAGFRPEVTARLKSQGGLLGADVPGWSPAHQAIQELFDSNKIDEDRYNEELDNL